MTRSPRRALFLDRDGVVNHDTGYAHLPSQMVFIDGIFDLCREAAARDYLRVIVTNQSGIGRGWFSEDDFQTLTAWMLGEFRRAGCPIDLVRHCPALPESGDPDRKPAPGMILDAARRLDIDLEGSIMIGDRGSDMQAGRAAGVGTLLLFGGQACGAGAPAGVVRINHLTEAIKYLTKI